jgi:ESS family glutamate:Na+ symporter
MGAAEITKISLSELNTAIVALIALQLGFFVLKQVGFLRRLDIPAAVIGAVVVSLIIYGLRAYGGIEIEFGAKLRDLLLLVFFATIGLSAKLSALKAGGRPLLILCGVTLVLLVLQNVGGILVAMAHSAQPFYGLLLGSASFVGGPGTALAWAKEGEAMGLRSVVEVAVASATLAVVVGALVSGPITGWLVRRHGLKGGKTTPGAPPWAPPEEASAAQAKPAPSIESALFAILVITCVTAFGDWLNGKAGLFGMPLPGFLSAMIAGIIVTNVADALRLKTDFGPVERGGDIALQLFLSISLMSVKLWVVAQILQPLLIAVVLQVVLAAAIAIFLLFRWLGRDYEAAVTVGGFLGFGLSSMPVALATMEQVAQRYGPAPKAFLLITLAGSFFVDFANAFVIKGFLALPFMR